MTYGFSQFDVFSTRTGEGNPVAVVHDAQGLSTEEMQRFAAWTNLSESTFLLPPSDDAADYRVRIFTPTTELPFAGHPTLGSCAAWLAAGGRPRADRDVVQQCGIGQVLVRRQHGGLLAFAAPPLLRRGPVEPDLAERVTGILGRRPVSLSWGDNGPGWVVAELPTAQAVRELTPHFPDGDQLDLGVFGPEGERPGDGYEVRAFFADQTGRREDPVTGSLNAAIATILAERDPGWRRYTAAQGSALGRRGRIEVEREGDQLWIGGRVVPSITGRLRLP